MRIRLLTITQKTPSWLNLAYKEYTERLQPFCQLELVEVPAEKRSEHSDIKKIIAKEGERLLALIKPQHFLVALDVKGTMWDSVALAQQLAAWQQKAGYIDLIVGGPDGLSDACLQRANAKWSLSPLTFPHFLVRLIVAEQIYRAFSILHNHPYHRG